jgi:hypothetical protein
MLLSRPSRVLLSLTYQALLINELASAGCGGNVAAVNRVVTIGTAANQWKACAVVVGGMTLQTKSRLADREQVLIRRTVWRVTLHAVFVDGRVLIRERSLKLGMALEAEFVAAGRIQTVSSTSAMRIVAVYAGHLAFTDGVVIREVGLCLLLVVTLQTFVVQGAARLQRARCSDIGGMHRQRAAFFFAFGSVDGVTAGALQVLGGMGARKPVPNVVRLGVTTQAGAVGFFGAPVAEADDLVLRLPGVAAGLNVQAARAVTLLAVHIANGM